jgi:hypothetical protein
MSLAMPVERGVFWPILGIAGQENPAPFKIRETLSRHSVFDGLFSVDDNPVIIANRPKAAIKLPMCLFVSMMMLI